MRTFRGKSSQPHLVCPGFMYWLCSLIYRLDAVQTEDELSDVYQHFMLYYGRDVIAMKNKKVSQMNEGPPLLEEDEEEKEKEKSAVKHARR